MDLPTMDWSRPSHGVWDGKVQYALEGSVFMSGAAIQWLRDELKILDHAADSEKHGANGGRTQQVLMWCRRFTGLGAPYWDSVCERCDHGT